MSCCAATSSTTCTPVGPDRCELVQGPCVPCGPRRCLTHRAAFLVGVLR